MATRIIIGSINEAQKEALTNLNNQVVRFIQVAGQDAVQIKYCTTNTYEVQLATTALNLLEGSVLLGAIQKAT